MGKPSDFVLTAISDTVGVPRNRMAMVGDRLDTDILFGQQGGLSTMLVLSGEFPEVSGAGKLLDDCSKGIQSLWSVRSSILCTNPESSKCQARSCVQTESDIMPSQHGGLPLLSAGYPTWGPEDQLTLICCPLRAALHARPLSAGSQHEVQQNWKSKSV